MLFHSKEFFKGIFAAAAAGTCALFAAAVSAFPLENADYYLYSPSSQAQMKKNLTLAELPYLQGQSGVYTLEEEGLEGLSAEQIAKKIEKEFGAKLLFTEEACGAVCFYCYSPRIPQSVQLYGQRVNLHIAVRQETVAVGMPLIFGGY